MVPYQYTPLDSSDSIRLVKIGPDIDQSAAIRLSICQTLLQDARKYEALSYEWGTQMCDKHVLCDGQEFQVTRNLAIALKHLRTADGPRWIWIDAICINQKNIPERNHQVSRMRDIYAGAETVLIWIGDGLPYTAQSFRMITKLAKLWQMREIARIQAGDIKPPLRIEPSEAERPCLLLQDSLLWQSLFSLFTSSYFDRTWIIQEITVSTRATVMCGKQQVAWKLFHWAVSFVSATTTLIHRAPDPDVFGTISAIASFASTSKQDVIDPLSRYLRFVQNSKCTDARDKVFGLLGLRKERLPHLAELKLRVDYTKTVQQVYQDAAEYVILSQQDLEICYGHLLTSKKVQGLPSWVPDWSSRADMAPTAFLYVYYKVRSLLPGKITFDGSSMRVSGLVLDSIDFVTSMISSKTPLPDIKRIILHLCKRLDTTIVDSGEPSLTFLLMVKQLEESVYKDGKSVFEALWRTLIGNIANFEPARPEFKGHFQAVLDTIMLQERGIVFDNIDHTPNWKLDSRMLLKVLDDKITRAIWQRAQAGNSLPFFLELVNTIHGRVFFTTTRGYMGFGAMGAKIGDQVCILGGGWTPFVLRDHSTHFEMIGDSYLHGLMQGERLDIGTPKVKRFRIR